jgi:DNA-binding NtrC family response regulator
VYVGRSALKLFVQRPIYWWGRYVSSPQGFTSMHTTSRLRTDPLDLLVVDDEADARDLLGEFCTSQGFRVAFAHDGRAAVTALERATPAFPIVIADLHLPHADGFAVLEAARRANPSCYVIIVTGYATIDGAVRAVRAGAYDFLAKPFVLGQLELVLNRIRDRMALEEQNRRLSQQAGDGAPKVDTTDLADRVRRLEDRVATLETLVMRVGHRSAVSR